MNPFLLIRTSGLPGRPPFYRSAADFKVGRWVLLLCLLTGLSTLSWGQQCFNVTPIALNSTTIAIGTDPRSVAKGDFNGDGKSDLVVTNYGSGNVSILLGNGSGGFGAPTSYPVGTNPRFVATSDFNADGKLDLAVVNFTHNVSI